MKSIDRLTELIKETNSMINASYRDGGRGGGSYHDVDSEDYEVLVGRISVFLEYGVDINHKQEFLKLKHNSDSEVRYQSLREMRNYLVVCKEELETKSMFEEDIVDITPSQTAKATVSSNLSNNTVFVVHGHDNESKETIARFVESLGLRALILHEQPNSGRTIIEKFEAFADKVSYAVVLLTPDDLGTSVKNKTAKYRARQNVIFELGFFIAKLGRNKVCALTKGDIELPSDYHGVVYVSMDQGGAWKLALAKEMRNSGLNVNSDKLI
jgi:predicted nucleotide-binding protein